MSDSPPAKAKPGSLRDRIAAFEQQKSASSAPAPAPRPKPGGLSQWKPRQQSPPSSPGAPARQEAAGLSASDAKESIKAGGSLKDRMAALQGLGAFGGGPSAGASPPPKPAEKPKWKPPPQVTLSPPIGGDDEDDQGATAAAAPAEPPKIISPLPTPGDEAGPVLAKSPSPAAEGEEGAAEEGEKEADPEEEERQRRAAIAARMAKLGGARVGMGPPVFGRKPEVKKPSVPTPKAEDEDKVSAPSAEGEEKSEPASRNASLDVPVVQSPPSAEASDKATSPEPPVSTDYFPAQPTPSPGASPNIPARMPVPAGPRRAAPPRKKPTPKSPSPQPAPAPAGVEATSASSEADAAPVLDVGEKLHTSPHPVDSGAPSAEPVLLGDHQPEIGEVNASVEDGGHGLDKLEDVAPVPKSFEEPAAALADREVSPSSEPRPESPDEPEVDLHAPAVTSPQTEEPPAAFDEASADDAPSDADAEPAEVEEDEETRRKRIADRIAKAGGFNPLGAPPAAITSPSAEDLEESVPARDTESPAPEDHARVIQDVNEDVGKATHPPPESKEPSASVGGDHAETAQPRVPYGVVQLGGPEPTEEEEEEEGAGRDLPTAPQTQELEQDEAGPDADAQGETPSEDEAKTRDADEADAQPVAHAPPPLAPGEDDDEGRPSLEAHAVGAAAVGAPGPRGIPEPEPHDEEDAPTTAHLAYDDDDDEEDDEMAPPRITRPLPTAPARTVEQPLSPPAARPPVPIATKRASLPPPARSVPIPIPNATPTIQEASPPRQDVASVLRRSSTKRMSIPPPSRAAPSPTRVPTNPSVHDVPLTSEPEEIADPRHSAERDASPASSARRPSVPPPVPPPVSSVARRASSSDSRRSYDGRRGSAQLSGSPPSVGLPAVPASPRAIGEFYESQPGLAKKVPPALDVPEPDGEVLDEEHGDPIDPRFYSPPTSSTSIVMPRAPPPSATSAAESVTFPSATSPPHMPAVDETPEQDPEQARRRTIAERMAKLGGIKFGAAPPMPVQRAQPSSARRASEDPGIPGEEETPEGGAEPAAEQTEAPAAAAVDEEEDEQARRQRITAKLAGMGGMRFGMLPQPGGFTQQRPIARREESSRSPTRSAPLARAPAVPPYGQPPKAPPTQPAEFDHEVEQGSTTSDDGVQVEAEESELEEVHHADAEDEFEATEEEEEAPPPPPPRAGRPPVPLGRPPPVQRRTSVDVQQTAYPPRRDSHDTGAPSVLSTPKPAPQHSDFVMVGQSDDEAAPPPPGRPSRAAPPPRSAPPPPQPEPIEPSAVGQWELPSIPTGALDFGDSGATSDLSASAWSEDSTAYPSTAPTSIAPPSAEHTRRPSAQPSLAPVPPTHLTPDELKALWGRVGVQVHEAALSLLERSKRALVGNGSYAGFVGAVLEQVPNALPPQSASEYGYLVYAQTGGAVRTRASEILPGDVIVLEEAKLKGHKGLHNYSVIAGEGLPCVGVVSEYDAKKLKVKALQANQHVGQATVESVSYRLEDLKSGSIKVYRVLEA